jgi:hypothetical protein
MLSRRIAAGGVVVVALLSWTSARADTLTCESGDGREQHCSADTRGGVWLETQLSRAPCRQGETWGYDNRGVWTSNGCRARFGLGTPKSASSGSGSNANAAAAVAALAIVAAGAAAVHHEHEKDRRDKDRSDYYRDDYYSYDPPPRNSYDYGSGYRGGPETLRCESDDGRQRFCPVDTRGARVELSRQMSRSECRFGRNWGYDRRGVWVNGGCRGEFSVYRR